MVAPTVAVSFAALSLIVVVGGTAALLLLGLLWPGDGSAQLDWKPSRSPEQQALDEIDDVQQMLQATNARRRRRGAPELDEDAIEWRLAQDRRAHQAWIDAQDARTGDDD